MSTTAPYGSWASPITAGRVASGGVRLGQVTWSGDDLYWLEGRPDEGGRSVVVRRSADGVVADVIPEGLNARTTVHEYGGGSYWVHGPTVYFTNFEDQRLYRVDPGEAPRAITPEPVNPRGDRYADGVVTPDGNWIICVRERHVIGREAVNEIVGLPADGSALPHVLVTGPAFFSFPRLSSDGKKLAWTNWGHPRMPWDGTELWLAEMGAGAQLRGRRLVVGGPKESIFQPSFSPSGQLHFISDRSGWWNIYADDDGIHGRSLPSTPSSASPVGLRPLNLHVSPRRHHRVPARRVRRHPAQPGHPRAGLRGPRPAVPVLLPGESCQLGIPARLHRRQPGPGRRGRGFRYRRGGGGGCSAQPQRGGRPGDRVRGRADRVPEHARRQAGDRPCPLLQAEQPRLLGARRRASAAGGVLPRRSHVGDLLGAQSRDPVLDQPRLRRRGRQLRR